MQNRSYLGYFTSKTTPLLRTEKGIMAPMDQANNENQSNRRDFISGRATVRALGQLADTALGAPSSSGQENSPPLAANRGSYLTQLSRRAMACEFEILWDQERYGSSTDTALAALDVVDHLESQLSIYRADSEVSQLNQQAHQQPVKVSRTLYQLLQECKTLHEQTAGCFDITSSPLSKLWGFHRRQGELPGNEAIELALQTVGSQWLILDSGEQTVQFEKPALEINLGSIGKGYALDRCSLLLEEAEISDYIMHGGMSSIIARGSRQPSDDGQPGWHVALRHPLKPEKRLAEIRLHNRALGTSGSANQFFYHQGKRFGHVIDPRTGHSADEVLSVTVLAPTAAQADALATAFFVMGKEAAFDYCEQHPEVAVLFVLPGSLQGAIQIQTWGLTENDWWPSELGAGEA